MDVLILMLKFINQIRFKSMQKNLKFNASALIISLLFLSSCQPIMRSIIGINNVQQLSQPEIIKYALKYNVDTTYLYSLNDTLYKGFIKQYDNSFPNEYFTSYQFYQPLFMFGFDSIGKMQFFLRNCNVSGFPNIKWNRYGYFNSSPLLIPSGYLPDSSITFNTINAFLIPLTLDQEAYYLDSTETIVVCWSHLMGRQSKRLIETVQDYKKNVGTHAYVYYVNTDNFFYLMTQDTSSIK